MNVQGVGKKADNIFECKNKKMIEICIEFLETYNRN